MKTKDAMTTRHTCAVFAAILAFSAMALPASAQTSEWSKMSTVGDWWTWNPPPSNMQLISNDTWQATFFIKAMPLNRYKFVANADWSFPAWGDSNQTVFTETMQGEAERVTGDGHDILHSNLLSGFHTITFNDQSGWYKIELTQPMEANYGFMAVVGDFNAKPDGGWDTTPNMTLVSNYTWQVELFVPAGASHTFKFVAHNSWGLNWGELNQSVLTVPITNQTAEFNTPSGRDITIQNAAAGIYRFTFNDSTLGYRIEFVRAGQARFSSMAVSGTFNGWNSFPNMTLFTDHIWQATFTFNNAGINWFKLTANASWVLSFGETNQSLYDIPVMGICESNAADIKLSGPLDGTYYFRFNDTNLYFEVIPEGIMQTMNTWTRKTTYGTYVNDGWVVSDGRIDDDHPRYGYSTILHDTNKLTGAFDQYLLTPYITNGITQFEFWYRNWSTSPSISFEIQKSFDGTNWLTIDTVTNLTSVAYQQYATNNFNETNSVYIRVIHTGGREKLLIDDFHILEAVARVKLSDVTISPPYPWSNDTVNVAAYVIPNTVATGVVTRTYYRVGTTGAYTAITMTGAGDWRTTTSSIPAKPVGTVVYYYVGVTFGGRGNNSPRYWPEDGSNNPAWYGIPRTKQGTVWINEVNAEEALFAAEITNEFIELCGPAQSDIGGWNIQLFGSVNELYASYPVQINTILPNDDSGFGFFVLGYSNVPNVNLAFTHTTEGGSYLKPDGGVRILNEFGVEQYALSYGISGSNLHGFVWIGIDPAAMFDDPMLTLTGTGSNYVNFVWTTNDVSSPGGINALQFLTGGNLGPLPFLSNVWFTSCLVQSQVTIRATTTNGWTSAPYYSTRITNQWSQWIAISPYNSTYANGISTVSFDYPTGVTNAFFRLITTRSW
jgi:hypothetical protein